MCVCVCVCVCVCQCLSVLVYVCEREIDEVCFSVCVCVCCAVCAVLCVLVVITNSSFVFLAFGCWYFFVIVRNGKLSLGSLKQSDCP